MMLVILAVVALVLLAIFGIRMATRPGHNSNTVSSSTESTTSSSTSETTFSTSNETTTTESTRTELSSTSPPSQFNLPGTDAQGFAAYPGARCDPGNPPAVMARTTKSVLVICQTAQASFYYRGVRLSDNAGIELANAVRSSGGFDVTNPTDGTRYQVRPTGLTIVQASGQAYAEPMLEYASG
jgi:hypothetical protein